MLRVELREHRRRRGGGSRGGGGGGSAVRRRGAGEEEGASANAPWALLLHPGATPKGRGGTAAAAAVMGL